MAPAAVTAPRSALSTGAVAEEIAQPLNAMTLEAMRIPKAELGPESAFMRDGQLKSKILK